MSIRLRGRGKGRRVAGLIVLMAGFAALFVVADVSPAVASGVVSWGPLPIPFAGLSDVQEVSASDGRGGSAALLSDGTVVETRGFEAPQPVAGLSEVTAISKGPDTLLALLRDGRVMAYGYNEYGELGDGSSEESEVPVEVSGIEDAVAVSAGENFGLALLSDGTVKAWGRNSNGELGDGSFSAPETCSGPPEASCSRTPVTVKGLSGITAIDAGRTHSLALLAGGSVVAWGANREGQLGEGGTGGSADEPVPVGGLSGVTAVSAGDEESLALLADGTVRAWGGDRWGQLGFGENTFQEPEGLGYPVTVSGLSEAAAISAGGEQNFALLRDGTVVGWGWNAFDEIGSGAAGPGFCYFSYYDKINEYPEEPPYGVPCASTPVAVAELTGVTGISAFEEGGALAVGPLSERVTGVTPAEGSGAGGTEVTISGTDLAEATSVHFGSAEASFTGDSQTSISATAPPGTGTVDVTVTTPAGTTPVTPRDRFDYAPSVLSVAPNQGPTSGGTSVTIEGANFVGVSAVEFGSSEAASFTVNSPTSISAESPPGTGDVDVTVLSSGGSSPVGSADRFSYVPLPEVTTLEPASGVVGTLVTIRGSNLGPATAVKFGAKAATSFYEPNAGQIDAVVPRGFGTVDLTVTTAGGTSPLTPADEFTYQLSGPPPTVTKVSPAHGPGAGGTTVKIVGTNFSEALQVRFGAVEAESYTVVSAKEITVVSPPGASGVVDVTVRTLGGVSALSSGDRFEYKGAVIAEVSPNHGPRAGGTEVTIRGSGFIPGKDAIGFEFGKGLASEVQCSSSTVCSAIAPAAAKSGTVDLRAIIANKKASKKGPADRFTYE